LVTMLLSVLFLRDHVTRLRTVGFLLGFVGIIFTSLTGSGEGFMISSGDVLIFLAMLVQAISFILISKLNPTFDPRLITGYMLILGSFFIFISSLLLKRDMSQITNLLSWKLGAVFLFSAIIATAFGHMTFNYLIKLCVPSESVLFIYLNTIFALICAVLFLGEPILPNHYFGLILIIFDVFLESGSLEYMLKKRKQKRT